MTPETQIPQQNEYGMSVMNFFDKSTIYTALLPAHAIVDIATESGYKDLEWHPLRFTVAGEQLRHNLGVSQYVKDGIGSLHQSWRIQKTLAQVAKHPYPAIAAASFVLLPETDASLTDLQKLQRVLGKQLPVVLYPRQERPGISHQWGFAAMTYQPLPEVLEFFGVQNVEEMIKKGKELGYTGVTIDLTHIRESEDGKSLGHWKDVLPLLLPDAVEVHVSAGRVERKTLVTFDPMEELRDLYKGHGQSELIEMLRYIRQSGWQGRFVTEIPAVALHALGNTNPFESPRELAEKHKRLVKNIQDILG